MEKGLRVLLLFALIMCQVTGASAATDYRAMMLEFEAEPLDWGSLSMREDVLPIACSPDEFVDMLKGVLDGEKMQALWAALSFTPSATDNEMSIDLPYGGGIIFPCTDEYIWRQSFADVSLTGESCNVELVYFGTSNYCNYAFIFLEDAQGWSLIDCLYAFEKAELYRNSEVAWLVGQGIHDSTQETRQYEQWYNLKTRKIDASFVTLANIIAGERYPDLYDDRVQSASEFSTYAYADDTGKQVVDCGLKVVKYLCLQQWKNYYVGDGLEIRQMDDLAQVDIYRYNQDIYALEPAGIWQYEDRSPLMLEGLDFHLFLSGAIKPE